jgi:iron complex transport system ATP-binding protein
MSEIVAIVRGMGVELGGRRIIDGVSLDARSGRTVAVVGPNGAGKTTMLRALAGLIPCSGETTLARRRAYCAQKPTSAWDYRVGDLGEIIGESAGFGERLKQLGVAGFEGRRLSELSGGEQKCAHLAMTLAALPEPYGSLLLLDEPAASLDLAKQAAVAQVIRAYADAGAACVVATHDLGFARGCDEVIVLEEGRMVAAGRPADALSGEIIATVWGAQA